MIKIVCETAEQIFLQGIASEYFPLGFSVWDIPYATQDATIKWVESSKGLYGVNVKCILRFSAYFFCFLSRV